MKLIVGSTVLIIGLFIYSPVFGQDLKIPEWLRGIWRNSFVSNSKDFEDWTFSKDSIWVMHGGFYEPGLKGTCLNSKYSEYKISTKIKNNLFKLTYTKGSEIVIYEFKLQNLSYHGTPVLTYSLVINGKVKRDHLMSCNLVFTKD